MNDEPVIKWFIYWCNKAEQWHAKYLNPKYTRVVLTPNKGLMKTHHAFPLAGVFGYCQRNDYDKMLVKRGALQWAADSQQRIAVFLVNPQTRGVQIIDGGYAMERVKAQYWQDREKEMLTVNLENVPRGALGHFFQALNSWRGDWEARKEKPLHLWNAHEKEV